MQSTPQTTQPVEYPSLPIGPFVSLAADALISNSLTIALVLALLFWRRHINPRSLFNKLAISSTANQDIEITKSLSQMMVYSGADRVLLCQYHNGEVLASGQHYKKLTATHEVAQAGISSIYRTMASMPLSLLAFELKDLETNPAAINHLSNVNLPITRQRMVAQGIEACAILPLFKEDGGALGLIFLQYVVNVPLEDMLNEEMIAKLQTNCDYISYILKENSSRMLSIFK